MPVGDDDDEASIERNMAAVSPIPKIVTTPIKEDFSREDEDCRDEWGKSESEVHIKRIHPVTVTAESDVTPSTETLRPGGVLSYKRKYKRKYHKEICKAPFFAGYRRDKNAQTLNTGNINKVV